MCIVCKTKELAVLQVETVEALAELTDTDRINAIAEDGFSVVCEVERTAEGWRETWHCSYKLDEKFSGESLREAMDKAIIAYRNLNEAQGWLL